jgi:NAD-dependent deacetylase
MNPPSIVILTGAGISAESGVPTFRDKGGIWSTVRLEDVATADAFARNPEKVQAFYNMRRAKHRDSAVQPNAAHFALARLEKAWTGKFLLVTQNVDSLHERAGSQRLLHMHGEMARARCLACGETARWIDDITLDSTCPHCHAVGRLRPDVVWFGEMPMHMDKISAALRACDLFISIGTSGNVYPAAGFVAAARGHAETVELNLEPSAGSDLFHHAQHGHATLLVPRYVDALLARWQ